MEKITEEAPRNIKHKVLETLKIASIETLKRQKISCGIDEVLKLVQDSLKENISRESFDETLQFLIYNDSVKSQFRIGYVSPYQQIILAETFSI